MELEAINYYVNKCHDYLYPDIIIDDLVQAVKPGIIKQLGGFFEGELKMYYSSHGEVFLKAWLISQKGKTKEIYYEEIKEATPEQFDSKDIGDPEVLMTEVLPSFAKISTILDYVNSRRDVDLKAKYQDKERRKVAENINILKEYQHKFNRIIMMRPLLQPTKLHLPFFNYYYELVHEASTPILKNIILNSFKTDLKAVCLFSGQLKFGENPKIESFTYNDELALYGNLRLMDRDAKGWFFFGNIKEDN